MELYVKQFSRKFSFKPTNANMRSTVKMQLFLAKSEDMESKEPKEQLQDFLVMTEEVEGYVKKTLKLNDKQYEKLEEMEFEETVELANKIASKMLGIDPEAAEKVAKKPKK